MRKNRTLAGPTPTNISRNSEPDTVMNGTLASPAVALASSVLPVPGGPVRIAPCKAPGYKKTIFGHKDRDRNSCRCL